MRFLTNTQCVWIFQRFLNDYRPRMPCGAGFVKPTLNSQPVTSIFTAQSNPLSIHSSELLTSSQHFYYYYFIVFRLNLLSCHDDRALGLGVMGRVRLRPPCFVTQICLSSSVMPTIRTRGIPEDRPSRSDLSKLGT